MFNVPVSGTFILSINSILARQINIAIITKNISRILTTNYIRFFKGFSPIKNFRTRNNIIMITKNIFHIYITKSVEIAGIEPTPRVPATLKEKLLTRFLQNRLIIRALPLSYIPIKCTLLRFFIYPFPQATYYLLLIIANSVLALQVPILLSIKWNGY